MYITTAEQPLWLISQSLTNNKKKLWRTKAECGMNKISLVFHYKSGNVLISSCSLGWMCILFILMLIPVFLNINTYIVFYFLMPVTCSDHPGYTVKRHYP